MYFRLPWCRYHVAASYRNFAWIDPQLVEPLRLRVSHIVYNPRSHFSLTSAQHFNLLRSALASPPCTMADIAHSSRFLGLPVEIRLIIYELLLRRSNTCVSVLRLRCPASHRQRPVVVGLDKWADTTARRLTIADACQQLWAEALPLWFVKCSLMLYIDGKALESCIRCV